MKRLTTEQENELAVAAQAGDMVAKEKLFRAMAPLVKWLSQRYNGPDADDLFQAASVGWLHGLRTWKPNAKACIRVWTSYWIRAYAGRCAQQRAAQREHETSFEVQGHDDQGDDGHLFDADVSDDGLGAESIVDDLWRRQAHGIIDSMKDRRLALVLQSRLRGLTLEETGQKLRRFGAAVSRERVRQMEPRALKTAKALVRA